MRVLPSTGETRKLAAPPVSIGCLACHGRFFAASLPIHQKTCFQRNACILIPCEECKSCVRAGDYHSHVTVCTGKPLPNIVNALGYPNNGAKYHGKLAQCAPVDINLPEADGRVRCKTCERAFSQDRISKHQSVCHGKPRCFEPKQKSVIRVPQNGDLRNSPVKRPADRLHRNIVYIQRPLPSRSRETSFEIASNTRVGLQQLGNTSRRESCSYPGAQAMQGGGCDTSNSSSTSNPLVTNPLMTTRK